MSPIVAADAQGRYWHELTVGANRLARQLSGGTSAVTARHPDPVGSDEVVE